MKTRLHFIVLSVLLPSMASAQGLTFSTFTETYVELTNGTPAVTESWDDPDFIAPLGFTTTIMNEPCSELVASDFFLGGILATNSDFSAMNLILATTGDLIDPNYFDGEELTAPITYTTIGEPGQQIFKLQWQNVGFYDEVAEGTASNLINLQLWIYEADASIEVRFGPNSIKEPDFILMAGFTTGLVGGLNFFSDEFEFESAAMLQGPSADPTLTIVDTFFELFTSILTDIPQNGRVFRFAQGPMNVAENEAHTFNVWPQTTYNDLNFSTDFFGNVIYEIRDLSGRLTDQGTFHGNTRVGMSQYREGIYLVTLRAGNYVRTWKVLKV